MDTHKGAVENKKNRTLSGHPERGPGKESITYWKNRVKQRKASTGKTITAWQVRLEFAGREGWFNLGTTNRDSAASKARERYRYLLANGWEAALQRYKPKAAKRIKSPTVGQFLGEIEAKASLRAATFEDYARKFRRLVAEIAGITAGPEKHDYKKGGHGKWLEKIHAVKLDRITPEAIQAWKVRFLRERGRDPLAARRARITFNSILRCSKSLFSPKVQRFIQVDLPIQNPFFEVEFEKAGKGRYRSEINAPALLAAARKELGVEMPTIDLDESQEILAAIADAKDRREQLKIFLLGLGAGLRRGEIDRLTWRQVDVERGIIRLEITEQGGLKSADSEEDVDVDPDILNLLHRFRTGKRGSAYVVLEKLQPAKKKTQRYYRCERIFQKLTLWLRKKGIESRNPLHTLRKEFGSIVNEQHGIFAASSQLRHSSITLTRDVYTGKKARFAPSFGDVLESPEPRIVNDAATG